MAKGIGTNRKPVSIAYPVVRELSKKETVELLLEFLKEEKEKCGTTTSQDRGPLGHALKRLSKICNRTLYWCNQYSVLRHLIPEMLNLLDVPTTEGGIDLTSALQLSRIPEDMQTKVYQDSLVVLQQRGVLARADYIRNRVQESQKLRGIKPVGSPYKDPQKILNLAKKLQKLSISLVGEKSLDEYSRFLRSAFLKMEKFKLQQLCEDIDNGLTAFRELTEAAHLVLGNPLEKEPSITAVQISQVPPQQPFIPRTRIVQVIIPQPVIKSEQVKTVMEKSEHEIQTLPKPQPKRIATTSIWGAYEPDIPKQNSGNGKWESRVYKGKQY